MQSFFSKVRGHRALTALQFRAFRLVCGGQVFGNVGTWMDELSRGWLIYQLTDSVAQLGLVNAARALPFLAFGLFAGLAADRWNRQLQLQVTQAVSLGVNLLRYKAMAFALSGVYAGLAGGLYVGLLNYVAPEGFDLFQMVMHKAMVVVGGLGSIVGSVLGAGLLVVLLEVLRAFKSLQEIAFGAILLIFVVFFPGGLVAMLEEQGSVIQIRCLRCRKGRQERCGTQTPLPITLAHRGIFRCTHARLIDAFFAISRVERQ